MTEKEALDRAIKLAEMADEAIGDEACALAQSSQAWALIARGIRDRYTPR